MSLSISFVLLFFVFVLPGFIFRKVYFFGEFSKQFGSNISVQKIIFYTLLPSVILNVMFYIIYGQHVKRMGLDFLFCLKENLSHTVDYSNYIDSSFVIVFVSYLTGLYAFSLVSGYLSSRLIRDFRIDHVFKFFRYKNQWFYNFNSEVLQFPKIKQIKNQSKKKNKLNQKYLYTDLDVLTNEGEGSKLYSGILIDYELCLDDFSQLDKLYLGSVFRYNKKVVSETKTTGGITSVEDKVVVTKRPIPGELFILDGKNIENININFVFNDKVIVKKNDLVKAWTFIVISSFWLISVCLFLDLNISSDLYNTYLLETSFFGHILTFLFFGNVVMLLNPFQDNKILSCKIIRNRLILSTVYTCIYLLVFQDVFQVFPF